MQEWGDLKFFLATARMGSTLGAARELRVNQTTVARRIDALETALGVHLFDRNRDGYRLSEGGTAILGQAERIAAEVESLGRLAARHSRHLSKVVRVTTTEAIADIILTPWLTEFITLLRSLEPRQARLNLRRFDRLALERFGAVPGGKKQCLFCERPVSPGGDPHQARSTGKSKT
jgi:DNA-binding transcriptional LysR family regulator